MTKSHTFTVVGIDLLLYFVAVIAKKTKQKQKKILKYFLPHERKILAKVSNSIEPMASNNGVML